MEHQEMMDQFLSGIPNENLIPHLHAITSRKMVVLQSPDLMSYCKVNKDLLHESKQDLFASQQKLLAIFKLILKGDTLSSNYLLLNLLAQVNQRTPEGMALGQLCINISGVNSEQAAQISAILKLILPLQLSMKITTDSLSEMRFQPSKNYDTNMMEPGLFQMLDGTNIICDETHMTEGKVEKNGVANIRALAELIEDQKVVYDFQYMHQDFPISASVLIMSSTSRSMFKNAIEVPHVAQNQEDQSKKI